MELSEKEYVAIFATLAALTKLGENLLTIANSQAARIKALEECVANQAAAQRGESFYLN